MSRMFYPGTGSIPLGLARDCEQRQHSAQAVSLDLDQGRTLRIGRHADQITPKGSAYRSGRSSSRASKVRTDRGSFTQPPQPSAADLAAYPVAAARQSLLSRTSAGDPPTAA